MTIRILLADDHKLMRQGLRTLIAEQSGMIVVGEAEDGSAAIELARNLSPDIVIMDISMPGMNGIEATREISRAAACTRVIALSMHLDKRMILEMLAAGAAGYLLKDCAFDEVIAAVESVFSGSGWLSPAVADSIVREYAGRFGRDADRLPGSWGPERELLGLLLQGRSAGDIAPLLQIPRKAVEARRVRLVLNRLVPRLVAPLIEKQEEQLFWLTQREKEILVLVKQGRSNSEIAGSLDITQDTVKYHMKNIFQKLNVSSRSEAVNTAIECRLIDQ